MLRRSLSTAALFVTAFALPANAAEKPRVLDGSEVSTAMNFLSALGRLDIDAAAYLDEETVLDLPYAGEGMRLRGRANVMQFFERTMNRSVSDSPTSSITHIPAPKPEPYCSKSRPRREPPREVHIPTVLSGFSRSAAIILRFSANTSTLPGSSDANRSRLGDREFLIVQIPLLHIYI